jgi:hypothetical protein
MLPKISPVRCTVEPVPAEAKLSWPGCAFATLMRSRTVRTGIDGCTTRMEGALASIETGSKSRTGS